MTNVVKYFASVLPQLLELATSLGRMKEEEFRRVIEVWPAEYTRLARIRAIARARARFTEETKP